MENLTIKIHREKYTNDETTSLIVLNDYYNICGLELPNKNNEKRISCIPCGLYKAKLSVSSLGVKVIELLNVPNRNKIYIHTGNNAGDTVKGKKSDTKGCILVGNALTITNEGYTLVGSRSAMSLILGLANTAKEITVEITDKDYNF